MQILLTQSVNCSQAIPQGLWDSHVMKSNGKYVLPSKRGKNVAAQPRSRDFFPFLKNLEPLQLQRKGEKSWERGSFRYSRFASLRKAEQRGKKLRSGTFVDFSWNNVVVISVRILMKWTMVTVLQVKGKTSRSIIRRDVSHY